MKWGSRIHSGWTCLALISALTVLPAGQASATSYAYDAVGRLTSTTLNDGSVIQYQYDPDGNLTQYTHAGLTAFPDTLHASGLEACYPGVGCFFYQVSGSVDPTTNDVSSGGYAKTLTSHSASTYGTVSQSGNTVTYVDGGTTGSYFPSPNDSFTYTVSDGHASPASSTVSVVVTYHY